MNDLSKRLEAIGGCGDGNCIVHVRPGMHTNGGCRCSRDQRKMEQVVYAYRLAVAEAVETYKAEWGNHAQTIVRENAANARIAQLEAALKPFADTPIPPTAREHWPINYTLVQATFRDVLTARALLHPGES